MLQVQFPPVRKIFIPDPGHMLFDIDLAGADAQVVAWEADDEDLKNAFRRKIKIHAHNALTMYGPELAGPDGKREPTYTRIKRGVHLTNYGGTTETLARKCDMTIPEADKFQNDWLVVHHPKIKAWQERIMFELQTTGRTSNKFGYHIDWFERADNALWRQALAWTPQSTVAIVTEKAMLRLRKAGLSHILNKQVHDSLVLQVRFSQVPKTMKTVYDLLHSIVIPYPDPLIIPWGIKQSHKSWGDIEETTWEKVIGDYVSASTERELVGGVQTIHN